MQSGGGGGKKGRGSGSEQTETKKMKISNVLGALSGNDTPTNKTNISKVIAVLSANGCSSPDKQIKINNYLRDKEENKTPQAFNILKEEIGKIKGNDKCSNLEVEIITKKMEKKQKKKVKELKVKVNFLLKEQENQLL